MYEQAAAQGQTVLVATGDGGADDCGDGRGASVNVLATNPNVTAVGGTALSALFDGDGNATGYLGETVWNDAKGASGGGPSILFAKPAYQLAPGVPADGWRDVPDVALLASPYTSGYVAVMEGGETVVGGTSAAAPNWAGIVALLNQAGSAEGFGAINTRLYALARQQYAAGGSGPFHDVVAGDNSFDGVTGFNAGVGYDLCSGVGTPDVDLLVRSFVAAACPGDCNGDGVITIDEVLTGINIALGATALSQCSGLDANGDGLVTVDELLHAVSRVLNGC
jgi:pseudomonalisin